VCHTHICELLFDLLRVTHRYGPAVKISKIIESPAVVLLLFLLESGEVRHSEFSEVFTSRGTISNNLNDLEDEELIKRRVVNTKPVESYYMLTDAGLKIATLLSTIKESLSGIH